ncbi:MAG TPA: TIR domain-containing protein [Pyrinomonadaceae bacterium]|nr:TIR domain-containing protein [Pyrinomonadaceae bacterium]
MATLFLSHSSQDKPLVRRLANELRQRNISVWLDEWEIDVGENITEKIQAALMQAKFVAVWLTKSSVTSGWVTKEWQTKIYQEISSKQVLVLPLLAEDCEIPLFLSDKKYADFRVSFREGVASLMRTLSRQNIHATQPPPADTSFTISEYTRGFLRDLEGAQIPLPTVGNLNLVSSLKALPRSGKLLRLEGMSPQLPIRSIYDHVLSVAHSADCLLPLVDPGIYGRERVELARVIAYHDICEVVLGDIPQYTRLNRSKRNRARVTAEIRLSQLPDGEPERITNKFIAMFLQDSERDSLLRTMEVMDSDSPVRHFSYALDKLDPIIAVWRYIHQFRADESFKIDDFLTRMRHFFENPRVRIVMGAKVTDRRMVELVDQLQNPERARYYFERSSLLQEQLFAFPENVVRKLIEGRKLEFTASRKRRLPRSTARSSSDASGRRTSRN